MWWSPPPIKLFSSLRHNCNFAVVMNPNVNIRFPMVLGDPVTGLLDPSWIVTHRLRLAGADVRILAEPFPNGRETPTLHCAHPFLALLLQPWLTAGPLCPQGGGLDGLGGWTPL